MEQKGMKSFYSISFKTDNYCFIVRKVFQNFKT